MQKKADNVKANAHKGEKPMMMMIMMIMMMMEMTATARLVMSLILCAIGFLSSVTLTESTT